MDHGDLTQPGCLKVPRVLYRYSPQISGNSNGANMVRKPQSAEGEIVIHGRRDQTFPPGWFLVLGSGESFSRHATPGLNS